MAYNLRSRKNKKIEITLKLLNGKNYFFNINYNATLLDLYNKVAYLTSIDHSSFYFIKNHRRFPKLEEIENWMTVRDFNFKLDEANTLCLILRLGGLMEPFKYIKEEWFNL